MKIRRLSIHMIEEMNRNSPAYVAWMDRNSMPREDSFCSSLTGTQWLDVSNATINSNQNSLKRQQAMSNTPNVHSRPRRTTTNTSRGNTGTSTITFYRSTSKENVTDGQQQEDCMEISPNIRQNFHTKGPRETKQRGIDRSITLPRENHSWMPIAPILPAPGMSSNRTSPRMMQRTKMIMLSPTSEMTVTPEVTRPIASRDTSSSSIPSLPPLYPCTPPQSQRSLSSHRKQLHLSSILRGSNMRSVPSPRSEKLAFCGLDHTNRDKRMPPITMTPPLSNNHDIVDVQRPEPAIPFMITTANSGTTTDLSPLSTAGSSCTTASPVMLDLAPGVQIRLRGADETQVAIDTGFYIQCECMLCSVPDLTVMSTSTSNESTTTTANTTMTETTSSSNNGGDEIYCILDCDYFICPKCRSVNLNPMSIHANTPHSSSVRSYPGGLGLGFRVNSNPHLRI
jgi:hypothetical protein